MNVIAGTGSIVGNTLNARAQSKPLIPLIELANMMELDAF